MAKRTSNKKPLTPKMRVLRLHPGAFAKLKGKRSWRIFSSTALTRKLLGKHCSPMKAWENAADNLGV